MQSSVSCSQKIGTGPADLLGEEPGVVEPEEVVGVVMRVGDRVHPPHPLAEQLNPHLGRRVDQQIARGKRQQDAGPGPGLRGSARGADRTVAAQNRDARRRAGPQENQPSRVNLDFRSTDSTSKEPDLVVPTGVVSFYETPPRMAT